MKNIGKVIAIEEAFLNPAVRAAYPPKLNEMRDGASRGLLGDVGEARIKRMDEDGIDLQVLSLVSPGVQDFDLETGVRLAKETNDWLGEMVRKFPTRFAGFASLPTQDPKLAVDEFKRSVQELGMKGALINGYTKGRFLDEKAYWPLFAAAEAMDVPIYIHPRDVDPAIMNFYFKDYPELASAAWGWAIDTGTQVLRLMCAGVFDEYPKLKVIIGHMGEMIPFHLTRINRGAVKISESMNKRIMKKDIVSYMKDNIYITTSGVFEHSALLCALTAVGIDNILFSIDDPFADNKEAMKFLETAPLSRADKEKFAHGNAERILRL